MTLIVRSQDSFVCREGMIYATKGPPFSSTSSPGASVLKISNPARHRRGHIARALSHDLFLSLARNDRLSGAFALRPLDDFDRSLLRHHCNLLSGARHVDVFAYQARERFL